MDADTSAKFKQQLEALEAELKAAVAGKADATARLEAQPNAEFCVNCAERGRR